MSEPLYLRENTQIEPLVDRWHAHAYLVAPHTAALYLHKQLQIMLSYIRMPAAHAAALANPDMQGGEFIDYGGERVADVKALRERLLSSREELLRFRQALADLGEMVRGADECGLRSLYEAVPEIARGLVELTYDLRHQASFRLIEPLIYAGGLSGPERQELCLSLVDTDSRPFIFGTPRLEAPERLFLQVPFADPLVDYLHRLRYEPAAFEEICERIGLPPSQEQLLRSLLTAQPGVRARRHPGPGLSVRYFGHACLLFETADVNVLLDPFISYPYDSEPRRFTTRDLPERIDAIVITHAHHDHFVMEQLLALRGRIGRIIVPRSSGALQDPSLKLILEHSGFEHVDEIGEFEAIEIGGARITALPFMGEHCDLDIRAKMTVHLRFPEGTCLAAADCDVLDSRLFERSRQLVGPADALFISQESTGAPMAWAYGPLFTRTLSHEVSTARKSRGPDARAALELSRIFDVRSVYLYAMGTEPWLQYLMGLQHAHHEGSSAETESFLKTAKAGGLAAERLHIKAEFMIQ